MRFRSIVPAVVAALAVGGFSAYAANSHSSTARTHTATALVQPQIHSERRGANAGSTITPIGAILPLIQPTTVPNTGTQVATQALVQVHTQAQAQVQATEGTNCEAAEQDKQDEGDNAQAQGTTETESGDQNEATTDSEDETQAACVPPTAACVSARDALKALVAAGVTEDQSEQQPTTDAAKAADLTEDASERQLLKTAFAAVIAACGGQHGDQAGD
jgi:ATP-dependent Lon protease